MGNIKQAQLLEYKLVKILLYIYIYMNYLEAHKSLDYIFRVDIHA